MAAELGWVGLGVSPDFTGFKGQVDRETSKVMGAAGVHGGEQFGTAAGKSAGSRFKSVFKSAAKVAGVGLFAAGALAFKFGKDSLEEAREAQKVGALTSSTIKATGGAAKVSAKHVADLSGKISEKVGIDDEAIQSGANMILTFKNIRNEAGEGNDVFDQTIGTLTDLSAAMGTDAKSSAIQLGKALNDPVKGISALSRVGVTFTEDQKKQIEQLVKHGDALKAQKIILHELNSEFGGAAASQADSSDKLQVAWGNLKEEVGTELLPILDDLATFLTKKGIPKAREFFGWVKDTGVPAAKDFADELKPVVGHVKDLVKFLNDLPKSVKIGGLAGIVAAIGGAKLVGGGGGGALSTVGKVTGLAKATRVFETNPAALNGPGDGGGGATKGIIGTVAKTAAAAAVPVVIGSLGSLGVNKLQEAVAPKAFDKGISGTPNTGIAFAGDDHILGINDDEKEKVDALVDSVDRFKGALDLVGAKKVNPDLRIPNIMNEQNRLASFGDSLDLVGNKKVRPGVELMGVEHARRQIDGLSDALAGLAGNASSGIDAAGQVVIDAVTGGRGRGGSRPRNAGRDRGRQRNLGGVGGMP